MVSNEHESGTPAFDRALELVEVCLASEEYASRHGYPGSATYCAAWLKFRREIQSTENAGPGTGRARVTLSPRFRERLGLDEPAATRSRPRA